MKSTLEATLKHVQVRVWESLARLPDGRRLPLVLDSTAPDILAAELPRIARHIGERKNSESSRAFVEHCYQSIPFSTHVMHVSDKSARRRSALEKENSVSTDIIVCRTLWLLRKDPAAFAACTLGVDGRVPLGLVLATPSTCKRSLKRLKNIIGSRVCGPVETISSQIAVFKWAKRYSAGRFHSLHIIEDAPKFWTQSLPGVCETECKGSILLNLILGDVFVPGTEENLWAEYMARELLPHILKPIKPYPHNSGVMGSEGAPRV
jgi:hypothetical protein